MAELNIGKHCAVPDCNRLDFLPFPCPGCELIFCLVHKTQEEHTCSEKDAKPDLPEFTGEKSHACCYGNCERRELTPIICEACGKNFCLSHRHQTEHDCEKYEAPKERMTKTKEHVQNIVDSKPAPTRKGRGRKSKATAAKVALMKIKQKASGERGTPETERVYLNIILPLGSSVSSKPMYFSQKWTIGRVIDQAASLADVKNENNVPSAKKLRLFEPDTGDMYVVEETLESLLGDAGGVYSGGTLIMEYVDNDTSQIHGLDKYSL